MAEKNSKIMWWIIGILAALVIAAWGAWATNLNYEFKELRGDVTNLKVDNARLATQIENLTSAINELNVTLKKK